MTYLLSYRTFKPYITIKLETFFLWKIIFLGVFEGVDSESATFSF